MARHSKRLAALARTDARIREYACEDEGDGTSGHWIYLRPGWNWDGCHTVHEYSEREALRELSRVEACEPGCDCGWDRPRTSP